MGAGASTSNVGTADWPLAAFLDGKDPNCKKALTKFIKGGIWRLTLEEEREKDRETQINGDDLAALVNQYILPTEHNQSNLFSIHSNNNDTNIQDSEEALKKIKGLEILKSTVLLPLFIASPEYKEWVDIQLGEQSLQETDEQVQAIEANTDRNNHVNDRDSRLDILFSPTENSVSSSIADSTKSIDAAEIDHLLESNSSEWMADILVAVENLPVCVSIASARQDRRGFPLIYINKQFTVTTGYDRGEILGKNCRFLQCDEETQVEQIQKLSIALRDRKPVKVAITNKRKDGTTFPNYLALKPIFDKNGDYSFIVGCQYDLSAKPIISKTQDLKLVDDVLSIMPNILGF